MILTYYCRHHFYYYFDTWWNEPYEVLDIAPYIRERKRTAEAKGYPSDDIRRIIREARGLYVSTYTEPQFLFETPRNLYLPIEYPIDPTLPT